MPVINIELNISQEMLDAGGAELFAKSFGWEPTVKDQNGENIDNPVSAIDFGKEQIKEFVRSRTKVQLIKQAEEQARLKAIEDFKKLDK